MSRFLEIIDDFKEFPDNPNPKIEIENEEEKKKAKHDFSLTGPLLRKIKKIDYFETEVSNNKLKGEVLIISSDLYDPDDEDIFLFERDIKEELLFAESNFKVNFFHILWESDFFDVISQIEKPFLIYILKGVPEAIILDLINRFNLLEFSLLFSEEKTELLGVNHFSVGRTEFLVCHKNDIRDFKK